ncbi:MAG: preprotein translocase subunit YajC [Rhodospirillaceae bacterium]|nr:preprotein translocase subunit YajC [Rhodospirillaceae bacterium]
MEGQNPLELFLPLILIFVVFYFLLIRPQQKRMKEHRNMLQALRRGDRVVTGGGIIGTVAKVADDELTIEIADNVRVKIVRGTVSNVLARTEPAKGGGRPRDRARDEDEAEEPEAASADTVPADEQEDRPARRGLGRVLSRR